MWDLSCVDWQDRLREGRSLIPDLPGLVDSESDLALEFFDELRLPDVPGNPRMRDACGQWFRDIVRVIFGSWDPATKERMIRDILLLAPKGQSKTTYCAGLMLTAMMMNNSRRYARALFIAPMQAISDRAFEAAVGMIDLDADLRRRFKPIPHQKRIFDRVMKATLEVKTFDLNILTGAIPFFVLLDELHLLGKNPHTHKVLRQIRGGLEKTPEGVLIITTTQSDEPPVGAFSDELIMARKIRDGEYRGKIIRPMLPILYEFPHDYARDKAKWANPQNWGLVMPNLGRSVILKSLIADYETEKEKGAHAATIWESQHLNIELGIGRHSDRWNGVDHWEKSVDVELDFDALLARSEVVVVGIDGGGMDDLLGLCVLGRESGTGRWLVWVRAWAYRIVLERRQEVAATLLDFEKDGDLILLDASEHEGVSDAEEAAVQVADEDVRQVVALVKRAQDAGVLGGVALDASGIGDIPDELKLQGIDGESLFGDQMGPLVSAVGQGWQLSGAIKTAERALFQGTMVHADQPLMTWCVSNAKTVARGNATAIQKQFSGVGKIDPLIAMFMAVALMGRDPKGSSLMVTGADILDQG